MAFPFTRAQFFDVFEQYNLAVWPAPIGLVILAVGGAAIAFVRKDWGWVVGGVLGLSWAWAAVAYHFAFFTRINPAAWVFGMAFLLAALLFTLGAWRGTLHFDGPTNAVASAAALVLIGYSLLGYPLLNAASGHAYPRTPTFGLPCPMTIYTLGLLLLAKPPVSKALWVVPLGWSIVGSVAALKLGVVADYGLPAAAAVALAVLALKRRAPSSLRGEPAPNR